MRAEVTPPRAVPCSRPLKSAFKFSLTASFKMCFVGFEKEEEGRIAVGKLNGVYGSSISALGFILQGMEEGTTSGEKEGKDRITQMVKQKKKKTGNQKGRS